MMRNYLSPGMVLLTLGVWACGSDTPQVNPAPAQRQGNAGAGGRASGGTGGASGSGARAGAAGQAGTAGASGSAGIAGSSGASGSAGASGGGPVVRTVIHRDVFAGFDDPDNLMLDGGFELSGEMSSTWGRNAPGAMRYGNGAKCRSGLRCGIAKANEGIYGFLVSPRSGNLTIALYAKGQSGDCPGMDAFVVDAYSHTAYPQQVSMGISSLEPDGWCWMLGSFAAIPWAVPLVFFEPQQGEVVIDDVVVSQASSSRSRSALPSKKPVPADVRLRLRRASSRAVDKLRETPGARRSLRSGAPWTAAFEPWIR